MVEVGEDRGGHPVHGFGGGPQHVGVAAAPVGQVLHRRGADIQAERGEHDVGDAVGLGLPLPPGNVAAVFVVAADVPGGLVRQDPHPFRLVAVAVHPHRSGRVVGPAVRPAVLGPGRAHVEGEAVGLGQRDERRPQPGRAVAPLRDPRAGVREGLRVRAGIDLAEVEHVLHGEAAHDQPRPPVRVERIPPLGQPAGHLAGA